MLLNVKKILRRVKEVFEDIRIARMYAKAGVKFRRPTEAERRLIVSVSDLIAAGCSIDFDERQETWIVREYPDGLFEMKYTYVFEDPSSLARFLMTARIEVARDSSQALKLFHECIDSWEAGAATVGSRFVYKGNLQNWSDTAYGALILAEPNETIVGCVLSFQKEKLVYSILLRGLFFESADQVEEIIYPYLEYAMAWSRRNF